MRNQPKSQNNLAYFLAISIFVLFGSCEKKLDIELPYQGKELVIFSFLSPDDVVAVKVDRTYPPTGDITFEEGIETAEVAFYENGIFLENLVHTSKGNYLSPSGIKPKEGNVYHVNVKAPDYPEASSIPEKIPGLVDITNYNFDEPTTSLFSNDIEARKLVINFPDTAVEENFYTLQITGSYKQVPVAINTFYTDRPVGVADVCSFRGNWNKYTWKDACFNGQSYKITIGAETEGSLQGEAPDSVSRSNYRKCDKILFTFRSISKNYYLYLKSENDYDGFTRTFFPATQRHTNIQGGYGIVAAYNGKTYQINL
jgi:hypothetical protein